MQGDSGAAGALPTPTEQKTRLAEKARELGLEAFGVAAVPAELRQTYFLEWIQRGEHGEMAWLARDPERRTRPETLIPGAHSVVVVGQNYYQPEPVRRGRIAKYALGKDYHKVILRKLKQLCALMREWGGANRPYVDTGPLLEKPLAALAGIGWQAKNTLVINKTEGQWLFLGVIVTTLSLPPDQPAKDRCGSCTRCIDVCPTQAITAPYQLDARRCIAYLTIEHPGAIPLELRPAMGDHLFGCDDCLDICPWNRWAKITREERYAARSYPDLTEMLAWDEDTFLETFAGTPIRRLGFSRWLRNVAVVLGNTGTPADLPSLETHTADPDPLVREHAQWAVAEIRKRFPDHSDVSTT
jgi:epoxyqueuosine reductase